MHGYPKRFLFDFFSTFLTVGLIDQIGEIGVSNCRSVTSRTVAIMAHFLPSLCFATFLPFICIYATSVPPCNAACTTSNCGNDFTIGPPLQQNHQLRHWTGEPIISYGNRTLYISNHSYSVRINQP